MKRLSIALAAVIALLAVVGVSIYTISGRAGSSDLENWVGRCVVGVIESHLTAKVEFEQLDYQAPDTIVVDRLRLVEPGGLALVSVERMRLVLASVPRLNEPIQIARIDLEAPALRFAAQAEERGFVGWSSLVRSEVRERGLGAVSEGNRLSDVLAMRRIEIRDGLVEYRSAADPEPMVLRGVTTALDLSPESGEPGWYRLEGRMEREPQLSVKYAGRFNIDTMFLDLAKLTASMRLEEAQYETLPPQIQTLARLYALRGLLEVEMSASLPATDAASGTAHLTATLRDAFASFGESVVPVDEVRLGAVLSQRTLSVDAQATLLSGTADGRAELSFDGDAPFTASYEVARINLRQTLATMREGQPPRYDGILRASGRLRTRGTTLRESLSGRGTLEIAQGRLINLPVVSDLAKVVAAPLGGGAESGRDEALVEYAFMPDHLAINRLELSSSLLAARGDGKVFYDGRLALALNAGPMEKVQNQLGRIGDLFGKITDQLVKYYVGGTVSEPTVSLKPLGIGAGN